MFVSDIPMHMEDYQGDQSDGSLTAVSPVSLTSTTKRSSNQEAHVLQQQFQHVTAVLNAASASNAHYSRPQGRHALNYQQDGFKNAARQLKQAARDQTEMEVGRATARTRADTTADLIRIEQVAENHISTQQMQLLNQQTNAVAEKRIKEI